MNEYVGCFKKYAVFAGRARRREYWMFVVFNTLVSAGLDIALYIVGEVTGSPDIGNLAHLYTFAAFLPWLAVSIRRLHDIGHSGWFFLLLLIPLVGPLVLLVFFCRDSQPGANVYGVNPKGIA